MLTSDRCGGFRQSTYDSSGQTHGIRLNSTVALVDITGLPQQREIGYSRTTTTCGGHYCTRISVDGGVIDLKTPLQISRHSENRSL